MSGLLPIIRRVRRPLLPPEAAAGAKPAAVAAAVTGDAKVLRVESGEENSRKEDHGKAVASQATK